MTEDDIFQKIAGELRTGNPDAGIWARALAESGADPAAARTHYIRLRQVQLQSENSRQHPETGASAPTAARVRAEIDVKREILAKRLSLLGRNSLYSELGLNPAVDTTTAGNAIVRLREAEAQGRILSAEEKYAIQTLGDPASREQYDRKLLEELMRQEADANAGSDPQIATRKGAPLGTTARIALAAIVVAVAFGIYQDKVSKDRAREALRIQELALQAETARIEHERQTAAEAMRIQADLAERVTQLAEHQITQRQQQIDNQMRIRTTQIEMQQEQLEERKRQSALARQQAETRAEQEKARRTVYETERALCLTGRRNNNAGEIQRWCK